MSDCIQIQIQNSRVDISLSKSEACIYIYKPYMYVERKGGREKLHAATEGKAFERGAEFFGFGAASLGLNGESLDRIKSERTCSDGTKKP